MRPRHPNMRAIAAIGSILVLLGVTAGSAVAARPALFTIAIDLDSETGGEWFTSESPLLCDSGVAITDFHHGGGNFTAAGSFHLTKLIVCDDGSGSFEITVNAGTNFVTGGGTTGGWSVVPGSGTGDYTGLSGGGHVVGVNTDDPPIDLVDHYSGSLQL